MSHERKTNWKKVNLESIDARKYIWKKNRKFVTIWKPIVTLSGNWEVRVPSTTRYALSYDHEFNTLKEAKKFAENWIKENK